MTEYKYKEDEKPKTADKSIAKVRFKADYDITDVCMRFGNWSRKNLYLKQNTLLYYHSQPKKLKEVCSDNDAMLINDALLAILSLNIPQSKDIYNTLILYYWGEKQEVIDYIAVDGCVKEEWKRQAQGFHDLPNSKKIARGIREEKLYMVKPLPIVDIAKRFKTNWNAIDKLKKSGEDFLTGYFAAIKSSSGIELEMLKNKFL